MSSETQASKKCSIAEIVQFTCEPNRRETQCYPIPRIFRICPGRPTMEITKIVNINNETGEIEVPPDSRDIPVHGKSWRNIVRYSNQGLEEYKK